MWAGDCLNSTRFGVRPQDIGVERGLLAQMPVRATEGAAESPFDTFWSNG